MRHSPEHPRSAPRPPRRPAWRLPAVGLLLLGLCWTGLGTAAAVPAANDARSALASCERRDFTLTGYLLCVELHARRGQAVHDGYYAELDRLDRSILQSLSRRREEPTSRAALRSLHHAKRRGAEYRSALTLVDVLEPLLHDDNATVGADCDLFSLLNVGAAERHFGRGYAQPLSLLRIRYNHVVTAFVEDGRVTVLDTVDGSVRALTRGQGTSVPLTEAEVVALYLANLGLRLQLDGQSHAALTYLDEALRINEDEFVAHAGRAVNLLRTVATAGPDGRPASRHLLQQARDSANAASALVPQAEGPYEILGRIELRLGQPRRAQQYLEHALTLRADPVKHYYLALAFERQRRLDDAIDSAERGRRLLRRRPDPLGDELDVEIDYLLAHVHARRAAERRSAKDLDRSARLLALVARQRPGDLHVARLQASIRDLRTGLGQPHGREPGPTELRAALGGHDPGPDPLPRAAEPPRP